MVNEDETVYINGKHVVIMDIKKKSQKYRLNSAEDTDTTAFTIKN